MADKIKVIYIAGASRSGSTVLDIVLGSHDDVESVGELMYAPRVWDSDSECCACGQKGSECEFWRKVRKEWENTLPPFVSASDWANLRVRFERIRRLPRVWMERHLRSRAFQEYAAGTQALYRAITKVSGKAVVVDSSKSPVRALALSNIEGIDLRVIHLVRDGRGMAWSLYKSYKRDVRSGIQTEMRSVSVWRSALMWRIVNSLTMAVNHRMPAGQSMRLRYEDFVTTPTSALVAIGQLTGLDFSDVVARLALGDAMVVGHTIAGNRVRMGGVVKLKADVEWQAHLSSRQRWIFWRLAGRLAKRLGYAKKV